jgi:hypothetical protein
MFELGRQMEDGFYRERPPSVEFGHLPPDNYVGIRLTHEGLGVNSDGLEQVLY